MISVVILINGNPIMARSAVNTGEKASGGRVGYRLDTGDIVWHNPKEGAVKLAKMLLETIVEQPSAKKSVKYEAISNGNYSAQVRWESTCCDAKDAHVHGRRTK